MKLIKLFFAAFIFLTAGHQTVHAQIEVETPSEGGDKKVKVFSNEDYFDNGHSGNDNNLIKMNPLLISYGEVPFYYERRILPKLTVEIGIGPTISSGLTMGFAATGDPDAFGEDIESKLGITFKSGLRFYPNGDHDFPEGAYLAPELRWKNYRYSKSILNGNGQNTGQMFDMQSNFLDFVLLGGYQVESFDYVYTDIYLGAGIRRRHLEDFLSEYNSNGDLIYTKVESDKQLPILTAGFKVGVSF